MNVSRLLARFLRGNIYNVAITPMKMLSATLWLQLLSISDMKNMPKDKWGQFPFTFC
jgi:hypothetical protein